MHFAFTRDMPDNKADDRIYECHQGIEPYTICRENIPIHRPAFGQNHSTQKYGKMHGRKKTDGDDIIDRIIIFL
jgi:hypothetical protein